MKYSYRVSKYNPLNRNHENKYNEWTSFHDIGRSVTLEEYTLFENAYINAIYAICDYLKINSLCVDGLEVHSDRSIIYHEGQKIGLKKIRCLLMKVLREELWCKLTSDKGEVHFGYDYYIYFVSNKSLKSCFNKISDKLYVEEFKSPYLNSNY